MSGSIIKLLLLNITFFKKNHLYFFVLKRNISHFQFRECFITIFFKISFIIIMNNKLTFKKIDAADSTHNRNSKFPNLTEMKPINTTNETFPRKAEKRFNQKIRQNPIDVTKYLNLQLSSMELVAQDRPKRHQYIPQARVKEATEKIFDRIKINLRLLEDKIQSFNFYQGSEEENSEIKEDEPTMAFQTFQNSFNSKRSQE